MSELSALMQAAVQKEAAKPDDNQRAAKLDASRKMSERIAKIFEEHPEMTAREFSQLYLGGLKAGVTGYKMIGEYFAKAARLMNVGVVNPYDIPLNAEIKAAAKAAAQEAKAEAAPAVAAKPAKRAKK